LVDGPIAADESVAGGGVPGDARAAWRRGFRAADAPVDEKVPALQALFVRAWDVGRLVADVRRAVVDVRRCCPVWVRALPQVNRPARVWLAENPGDDLVHAAQEAAPR